MPTFPITSPGALRVTFGAGTLVVDCVDQDDIDLVADANVTAEVHVEVNPHSSRPADREYAEATRIEQFGDEIRVTAPTIKMSFGRSPSLDVRVSVPHGTSVIANVESAGVTLTGPLERVEVTSTSGDVAIEQAATLSVSSASGDVTCGDVTGDASSKSASGDIRVGDVGGVGVFSTASGDINVASVAGSVQLKGASGDLTVGRVAASVAGRAASSDVTIGSVQSGTVDLDTASGDITIGVADGVMAWLDLQSLSGDVSSALDDAPGPPEGPDAADGTVAITARSLSGDIRIRRAL